MRLLCIENGELESQNGKLGLMRREADFLLELCGYADEVSLAQAVVEREDLGDFDLTSRPELRVSTSPWRTDSVLLRIASYLRALPWVLRETRRADLLYVFLPGHLPQLFVAAARLLRRPYGVYLRSSLHLETARMEWALTGARFVLATTELLATRARGFCADSEDHRPGRPVFNRTVTLRDTWAKIQKRG